MKNSEEFRRTVFEKAERYQREERRRRRKIYESALICSICLVIGFTAFLGFWFGNIKDMKTPVLETTAAFPTVSGEDGSAEITSGESSQDMNATMDTHPEETQSGVMSSPMVTTRDATVVTTTTIAETTVRPESVMTDFTLVSDGNTAVREVTKVVLHDRVEFERYLSDLDKVYHISRTTIETLETRYDDAFFAENSLFVVRTSGYGHCRMTGYYDAEDALTLKFSEMAGEERELVYHYLIPVKKGSEDQITVNFHFISD